MALNMPAVDTRRISFGPCTVKIGPYAPAAAGGTPTKDIGAIRSGATLTTTRGPLELRQGSPSTPVVQYVTTEDVSLEFVSLERDLDILVFGLGAGVTTSVGKVKTFGFGGDMAITEVSILLTHQTPTGVTEEYQLWRCQGGGEHARAFSDEYHERPFTFKLLTSSVDWCNQALPSKQQLYKIVVTEP